MRTWTDAEGAWCLHARGTAEDGARIQAVLDELTDQRFAAARRAQEHDDRQAYAWDALVAMADHARTAQHPDTASAAAGTRGTAPRFLTLVRLDLAALVRGRAEPGEYCEITGIGPIPVTVARTLLGDSVLKLVLTRGADVANIVHLGRGPTAAQRLALLWSCPHCSNIACGRTHTEIDHRVPYQQCRRTELANLDPLCRIDHWLKTHRGWALTHGTGRRAFVPPDDPRHPRNTGPPP